MSDEMVMELGKRVLKGGEITFAEAVALTGIPDEDVPVLAGMAYKIRHRYTGPAVDLCAIVNGRSGMCPENCVFCAQSAHHRAEIPVYPLLAEEKLLAAAQKAKEEGALRFSIVTSGKGVEADGDFSRIVRALKRIKAETGLKLCASLGSLSPEKAEMLVEAGVSRYHHNVETSRSFYPQVCTTHTYEDRIQTIFTAQKAGMEVCSGGIIGLGESWRQRIEMAFALKTMRVHSVPINILNPIKGTPLENQPPLRPLDIVKAFAIYRFILPDKGIRTAGGREVNLRDLQSVGLMAGINGMLIGGYLTTSGRDCRMDLQMIRDLGLNPLSARGV